MSGSKTYKVWYRDDGGCSEAIRSGERVDVALSAYGANDFVLESLMGSVRRF